MLRKKRCFKIKKHFSSFFSSKLRQMKPTFSEGGVPRIYEFVLLNFIFEEINQFQSNFNVKNAWSLAEIQGQNLGSEYP